MMAADPEKIGPYDILERLGSGGMAVVFHAQHTRTGRDVALKTVLTDKISHAQSIQREMRHLPRLSHPGVVRLLDHGMWQDLRPWYAMELLHGLPLSSLRARWWPGDGRHTESTMSMAADEARPTGDRPAANVVEPARLTTDSLPEAAGGNLAQVLEIAYRLCDPLAYIHGEGIVHRDLKPSNIFIRTDGTPVLLDFGVVGVFEANSGRGRLDVQRSRAGTRAYMAPEQLRGDPVDSRADLYAFGVLLFELLTGQVPFDGDTDAAAQARLVAEPPAPCHLVANLPPDIDDLVRRLMAREARDRYGHADDVAAILAPHVADRIPEARDESQRPRRSVFLYRAEMAGRTEVLADLEAQLQKAASGEGTLIMVGGESGVGKTHLASHLGRLASARHHLVIVGESAPLGDAGDGGVDLKNAPLHPLRGLLRAVADRCRLASADAERIARTLLGPDAGLLVAYEPGLADFLPSAPTNADPALPESRQALFRALAHALRGLGQSQPLLLVLDDLQWADELTLDFLTWLPGEQLARSALVILGTYRSEDGARLVDLIARPRCLHITLNRLDAAAIGQMARDMLAMTPGAPHDNFTKILVEHSEGNPFFAAEYLRMAVSDGHFVRDRGRWRLAVGSGTPLNLRAIRMPRSLNELLDRRLEQVGPGALRVAQAAAVLGRRFEDSLLAQVAPDLDEGKRSGGLHDLVRLQILEEMGGQYRFRHDKMRETLYARIAPEARRDLHASAAAALLQAHGEAADFSFYYAPLAHHFQQAGQIDQAIEYLERAAELALRQFAHRDAITLFGELVGLDEQRAPAATVVGAATAAADGGAAAGARLRRVRWHRRLAEAHHGLGDLDGTTTVGTEALRRAGYQLPTSPRGWMACLARNLPVQILHRTLPSTMKSNWGRRGDGARELAMEAALIVQRLGQRYYFLDALAMITSSLWSVNLAERARTSERVAMPYALLGTATGIYRLHGVSARYFALARAAAEISGDVPGRIFTDYTQATVASGQCRWDDAQSLLQRALDEAESSGNHTEAQIARTVMANAAHFTGRFGESQQAFLQILETARKHENNQHIAWGLYGAARAMIPLGQFEEARALLEDAWVVLAPQHELPSKIICQGLLAGVHRRLGNAELALAHAEVALRLIRANNLIAYANVTGHAEAIETFLVHCQEAGGDPAASVRGGARQGLAYLRKLRWPLPIVRPAYLRLRAQRKWGQGRLAAARVDIEQAVEAARALGLPYEEALACLGLASLIPSADGRWQRAMDRAQELCAQMRCPEIRAPFGTLRVTQAPPGLRPPSLRPPSLQEGANT
jgi:serine/threonine protein kinase/tetratricopeptide (TPR) repeat protein